MKYLLFILLLTANFSIFAQQSKNQELYASVGSSPPKEYCILEKHDGMTKAFVYGVIDTSYGFTLFYHYSFMVLASGYWSPIDTIQFSNENCNPNLFKNIKNLTTSKEQ